MQGWSVWTGASGNFWHRAEKNAKCSPSLLKIVTPAFYLGINYNNVAFIPFNPDYTTLEYIENCGCKVLCANVNSTSAQ